MPPLPNCAFRTEVDERGPGCVDLQESTPMVGIRWPF